jgi:hypothetical protein
MLNGLYPIIVFRFAKPNTTTTTDPQSNDDIQTQTDGSISIPSMILQSPLAIKAQKSIKNYGIPIPIYLHESTTKIVFLSHNYTMSVAQKASGAQVYQNPVSCDIEITLQFSRTAIALTLLLQLLQTCYANCYDDNYRIDYYNKDIIFYNGRLSALHQNSTGNSTLSNLEIVLTKPATEIEQSDQSTEKVEEPSEVKELMPFKYPLSGNFKNVWAG